MDRNGQAIFRQNVAIRVLLLFLVSIGLMVVTSTAQARTEVLRWTHPNPGTLARFEALVGSASGEYPNSGIFLGLPTPDNQGVLSASIDVNDDDTVYIVIRAVGTSGLNSFNSNERVRNPPAGEVITPPRPPEADQSPAPPALQAPGIGAGVSLVPDPNALVRFDFENGRLDDWFQTGAGNSLIEDSDLFSIAEFSQGRSLVTASNETNIHSHYLGVGNSWSNVIIRGRMVVSSSGAGFGLTAYSEYPTSDTYYRLRSAPNDTFSLSSHPTPSLTCSNADTGVLPEPGAWYNVEWSIENRSDGNLVQARVWREGATRPSTPQADCLDTRPDRPLGGTIGVWAMGSGEKYWDDIEIVEILGSGGGGGPSLPLPPPVLLEVVPVR